MSSRRRTNTGARRRPSSVHVWNFTSATSSGSTHTVGAFCSGSFANGRDLRTSLSSRACTCFRLRSSKPEPTCEANTSLPRSYVPTRIAPSAAREPLPFV